jgi:hypothetical protein
VPSMSAKPIDSDVQDQTPRFNEPCVDIHSTWRHTLAFRILLALALPTCLILQCICAVIISQYSPSHSMKGEERFKKILALCESEYMSVSEFL